MRTQIRLVFKNLTILLYYLLLAAVVSGNVYIITVFTAPIYYNYTNWLLLTKIVVNNIRTSAYMQYNLAYLMKPINLETRSLIIGW